MTSLSLDKGWGLGDSLTWERNGGTSRLFHPLSALHGVTGLLLYFRYPGNERVN